MLNFYKFALCRFNNKTLVFWLLTGITAIVSNAVTILIPVFQKDLIDKISQGKLNRVGILELCLISVLGILATILETLLIARLFKYLQQCLQRELMESAVRNKNKIIEAKGAGAYLVSIFGDSEQISGLIKVNIFYVILQCVAAIIVLVIAASWSPIFLAVVLPAYVIMILIHYISNQAYIKNFQKAREMVYEVNPKVLEYIENRSSILSYSDIRKYESSIYSVFERRDRLFMIADTVDSLSTALLSATKTAALVLFFVLSLYQILDGKMELSSFIGLISYFNMIFLPITLIKNLYTGANKFKMVRGKIEASLIYEEHYEVPENGVLILEDCSFQYEEQGSGTKALEHLSLEIDCKIGLVGLSGEGKSTLIRMLTGTLTPTKGSCFYGGHDVTHISRYLLRTSIRYYSQDIEIFDASLEFNITLGKTGICEKEYEQKVAELIKLAGECLSALKNYKDSGFKNMTPNLIEPRILSEFLREIFLFSEKQAKDKELIGRLVDELPDELSYMSRLIGRVMAARRFYNKEKYENLLCNLELFGLEGRSFGQRGCKISGGEKNRVAMARFLLPEYGDYFIIDEPFTNLDVLSEASCFAVMKRYTEGMKGILISHKLGLLRDFTEKIVVIENGKISQKGSHDTLLKQQGLYQKLYEEFLKSAKEH